MQFLPLGLVHISSESCLANWKSVSLYRLPSNLSFQEQKTKKLEEDNKKM